jgi:2-methylisocitrate lyase-like PEP mutase family enzyme
VLDAIRRIASAVAIPVTADVERGYGADPAAVAETVRGVLDAGAVGVNLEDGREGGALASAERHAERIRAAREAAEKAGVPLFINARTDVYFVPSDDPRAQVAETLRRAKLFVGAGADGLFAPGIAKPDAIAEVVRGAGCPVNVYAFMGVPPTPALQALGVARVSVGCGPMQATLGLTRRIAMELREHGTYASLSDGALSVGELNALMTVDRRAAS